MLSADYSVDNRQYLYKIIYKSNFSQFPAGFWPRWPIRSSAAWRNSPFVIPLNLPFRPEFKIWLKNLITEKGILLFFSILSLLYHDMELSDYEILNFFLKTLTFYLWNLNTSGQFLVKILDCVFRYKIVSLITTCSVCNYKNIELLNIKFGNLDRK